MSPTGIPNDRFTLRHVNYRENNANPLLYQFLINPSFFIIKENSAIDFIRINSIGMFVNYTGGSFLLPIAVIARSTVTLIQAKPALLRITCLFPDSFMVTCLGSPRYTAVSSISMVFLISLLAFYIEDIPCMKELF
jgi:hypothetical protein